MRENHFLRALIVVATVAVLACSKTSDFSQVSAATDKPKHPVDTPAYPDIATLSAMLEYGKSNSTAIVNDLLARSEQFAGLHAFITLDVQGAPAKAAALDEQRQAGKAYGPLYGIPLVVKDNIHVASLPNTAGTPALQSFVPTASNEVVAILQAAGAIILGKTNMHELAFGITSNNVAFGAVRNPFDENLFPGGSSGGTASAVAAGLAPAGLGSDTGGSVRIPAALTGIVGFRPTTGRYPSSAVTPISRTRDTVGLLSRTVADLVVLDNVITGVGTPPAPIAADTIRLGVPRAYFYQGLDRETANVVKAVLTQLAQARVQLVETQIPGIGDLLAKSAFPIALYEVERDLPHYLEMYSTGVTFAALTAAAASPDVQGILAAVSGAGRVSNDLYMAAMEAREELREIFRKVFASQHLDAIIFPTTILPARPIEGSSQTVELNGEQVPTFPTYIHNTDPASIAALPAISLPVGLTAAGLPVGMEIDGPEQSDRRLLAIASTLEGIFNFSARPPSEQ